MQKRKTLSMKKKLINNKKTIQAEAEYRTEQTVRMVVGVFFMYGEGAGRVSRAVFSRRVTLFFFGIRLVVTFPL